MRQVCITKKTSECALLCICGFFLSEDFFSHLKDGHFVLPVDLVGRRVEPVALSHVLVQNATALHVAQTELTEVELWKPTTTKYIYQKLAVK